MINLIQAGINQNKIAYDPNTVYAIFTLSKEPNVCMSTMSSLSMRP